MMSRTFIYSLSIVLTFVEITVSGIILLKEASEVDGINEQENGFKCVLPPFQKNGKWTLLNAEGAPGGIVKEDTILKFQCDYGYKLTFTSPYVICGQHWNSESMPTCLGPFVSGNSPLEKLEITRQKRQYNGLGCKLPPYPENGNWTIIHGNGKPGEEVVVDTGLKFQCHPGYKLTPKYPYQVCDINWSLESIPKCLKKCMPLHSTPTTTLKCKDVTGNAISCSEATEGTYLTYQCIPYYEALGRKQSLYCSGGAWDFSKPVCQPVCGRKVNKEVTPLVYRGEDTGKIEYPWITAVYVKIEGKRVNNCGGTLLSPRIVLTAAHCITDGYGNPISEDLVRVGAGKYFREYGDTRDEYAQYSKAARLIVHEEFKGDIRKFQYDIALIVTKRLFTLGPVVQPVCYINLDSIYPHVGNIGELAGWGYTENNQPSATLRTIRIPYEEKATCTQGLPREWSDRYNFDDKMCAGLHKQNKNVCPGDSGSGLVFLNPEDNRFYVHGIVSVAPKLLNGFCNHLYNTLFTKVAHYYEWLDKKTTVNYVEECKLPPFPKNGKWDVETEEGMLPGDIVPSTSILKYSCRKGYSLSTVNSKFLCGPSLVSPSCELLCPSLNFPPTTISECRNKQNSTIDCEEAVDSTSMTYKCPQGYTANGLKSGTAFCSNGSWGRNLPQCTRERNPVPTQNEMHTENESPTTTPLSVSGTILSKPTVSRSQDKIICTGYPENRCTLVYGTIGLDD